jgi:hypothetical protein
MKIAEEPKKSTFSCFIVKPKAFMGGVEIAPFYNIKMNFDYKFFFSYLILEIP